MGDTKLCLTPENTQDVDAFLANLRRAILRSTKAEVDWNVSTSKKINPLSMVEASSADAWNVFIFLTTRE